MAAFPSTPPHAPGKNRDPENNLDRPENFLKVVEHVCCCNKTNRGQKLQVPHLQLAKKGVAFCVFPAGGGGWPLATSQKKCSDRPENFHKDIKHVCWYNGTNRSQKLQVPHFQLVKKGVAFLPSCLFFPLNENYEKSSDRSENFHKDVKHVCWYNGTNCGQKLQVPHFQLAKKGSGIFAVLPFFPLNEDFEKWPDHPETFHKVVKHVCGCNGTNRGQKLQVLHFQLAKKGVAFCVFPGYFLTTNFSSLQQTTGSGLSAPVCSIVATNMFYNSVHPRLVDQYHFQDFKKICLGVPAKKKHWLRKKKDRNPHPRIEPGP